MMREEIFDDGFTAFIEARHHDRERHAVGIYADNNLGVMTKDILLADSIEDVERVMRQHPSREGQLKLEAIDPGVAAGQLHSAMELTDSTLEPQVGEDYAGLRAIAPMRGDETPGYVAVRERAAVTQSARDRLRDEFLSSPEGNAFAPDSDDAYIASLAIDLCADYVDGRPLRWSPVLVELFMVGWIPRKALAAPELFQTMPAALEAWVRFAERKTAKPTWAIEATHNAIHRWHEEMVKAVGDPAAASPAKRLLSAARHAGVDLEHAESLNTSIARWNADPHTP